MLLMWAVSGINYDRKQSVLQLVRSQGGEDLGSVQNIQNRIMKYLKFIDSFGVPYIQRINLNEKSSKSPLGGLITLLVYGTSLAYFIYILRQWGLGEILPKSTVIKNASNYTTITQDYLFEITYWRYNKDTPDPFRRQRNILMPVAIYFNNGVPEPPVSLLDLEEVSEYDSRLIRMKNITIVQNSDAQSGLPKTREILLMICKCNPQLLKEGESCASEEERNVFFSASANFISFWINLQQFDPKESTFISIKKQLYLPFNQLVSLEGQIILQPTKAYIDKNLVFDLKKEQNYINDVQLVSGIGSIDFWKPLLGLESYLSMFIRIDPIYTELNIIYPKIGEILAQVGSIVSLLLLVRYALQFYNERILDCYQIDEILQIYFPAYRQMGTRERINFKKHYANVAMKKMIISNLVYEISRLQFFLQRQYGRKALKQTHELGILLKPEFASVQSLDPETMHPPKKKALRPDDFSLLLYQSEWNDQSKVADEFANLRLKQTKIVSTTRPD